MCTRVLTHTHTHILLTILSLITDMLEVHSDIAEALDEESMTALFMLDLLEAFNVIEHQIPLKYLPLTSRKRP